MSSTMEKNNDEAIPQVEEEEVQQLMDSLPKVKTCIQGVLQELVKYQGFWYYASVSNLQTIVTLQKHFRARDSDIIIANHPKTGTTWLKAILFATMNRFKYPKHENPLLKHHPQELIYNLEYDVYRNIFEYPSPHDMNEFPSPRVFSTHIPYSSLPESIITTKPGCRIVYISRNPLDTLVSSYYFSLDLMNNLREEEEDNFEPPTLEEFFEDFYDGKHVNGPYFEHVIDYWKASFERPDKVLFFKYEQLKTDPTSHVKKLAEFVGVPFSSQEESEGAIQDIIEMCSINNLKELEVNKSGFITELVPKKSYFRKGVVGDGINHFSPSMIERMNKLMQQKLKGTGLSL